jgi:hypothetical protein
MMQQIALCPFARKVHVTNGTPLYQPHLLLLFLQLLPVLLPLLLPRLRLLLRLRCRLLLRLLGCILQRSDAAVLLAQLLAQRLVVLTQRLHGRVGGGGVQHEGGHVRTHQTASSSGMFLA